MEYPISLGQACMVSYQIRRFYGKKMPTCAFDWVVSTPESIKNVLTMDMDNLLLPENCSVSSSQKYLYDSGSGLSFYAHDFNCLETNKSYLYSADLDNVREKYERRILRTRELLLKSIDLNIIRVCQAKTADEASKEITDVGKILDDFRAGASENITWVYLSLSDDISDLNSKVFVIPPGNDWKGDDKAWDVLLSQIDSGNFRFCDGVRS